MPQKVIDRLKPNETPLSVGQALAVVLYRSELKKLGKNNSRVHEFNRLRQRFTCRDIADLEIRKNYSQLGNKMRETASNARNGSLEDYVKKHPLAVAGLIAVEQDRGFQGLGEETMKAISEGVLYYDDLIRKLYS